MFDTPTLPTSAVTYTHDLGGVFGRSTLPPVPKKDDPMSCYGDIWWWVPVGNKSHVLTTVVCA